MGVITTKQKKNRAGLSTLDKVLNCELYSKQNKLEAEDTRFKANHKLNNTIDLGFSFEGNYKSPKSAFGCPLNTEPLEYFLSIHMVTNFLLLQISWAPCRLYGNNLHSDVMV
jgi:hypothetical protein